MNVATGNAYFDQTDAALGSIGPSVAFVRSYNSSARGRTGVFGPGWTHSFEAQLTAFTATPGIPSLQLWHGDGVPAYFEDGDGDSRYDPSVPFNRESWIIRQGDGSYIRYFRDGGEEDYDASPGRLTRIVDASGNAVTLSYDASGQLTTITSASGRALTLEYSGGHLTTLSGPSGLIATYGYDTVGSGRLLSVQYADAAGSGYTFGYHPVGAITTVGDLSGRPIETHDYDATGRAFTSEIAFGHEKYTVDYGVNRSVVTDALGNVSTYDYAMIWGQRMLTRLTGPCSACGAGGSETQEWTYDERGRLKSHKDGLGNITEYTYDQATGDLLSEKDPLGHVTRYTYDPQGRVHTIDFPDGGRTTYSQGPAGPTSIEERVSSGPPPTTRTTSIHYTDRGQPDRITDPRTTHWTFTYSTIGTIGDLASSADPLEQTDPGHHTTTYHYDDMGRLTHSIDPLGHPAPTRTYDVRGQVTLITNPDTNHKDFFYDRGGRLEKVTDELGRPTTYTYGGVGRLREVKDPADGITKFGYNVMSDLVWVIDPKGQQTSFGYDAFKRVAWIIYPDGRFESFTYDGAGHARTKTDRKTVTTTYDYDGDGRLLSKAYSDGTPPATYAYDANGMVHRLTSAANGSDTLTWSYDLVGQLLSENTQANASTVLYTYDPGGHRLSLSLVGTRYLVNYEYDDAGQLKAIDRGDNKRFTLGYDNANRRTSLGFPNGVTTNYGYDDMSRLLSLAAVRNGAPVTSFGYNYDPVSDRKTKTTPSFTETYGYDLLSRLTSVTGGPTPEAYSYDQVGNRLTSLADPNWSYVPNNRLMSNSTSSFLYDDNGNRTQKTEAGNTWTYEWNAENQLARVLKNGAPLNWFTYDPLGRRVRKYSPGNARTYTYASEDILREVVIPVDPNGTVVRRRYVHGPGIDEPLAIEDVMAGTYSYYHADALGSIAVMTDDFGNPVMSANYDAFGRGSPWGSYAFTGREWDAVSELYYYRARYYDPKVGRFLSEDPISFMGGVNFYAYAANNPIRSSDPFGLTPDLPSPTGIDPIDLLYERRDATNTFPNVKLPNGNEWTRDRERHCYLQCIALRRRARANPILFPLNASGAPLVEGVRLAIKFLSFDFSNFAGDFVADAYGFYGGYAFWRPCREICATTWCRRKQP